MSGSLAGYLARRLLQLPLVLLGISLVVFVLMWAIPGDPALAILGPYATPERVAALERSLGLDRALPLQYLEWLGRLLEGDLGRSHSLNRPVAGVIAERLGPTLLLAAAALLVGTVLGLVAGSLAAVHRARWPDRLLTLAAVVGISTPSFWLAMVLMLALAVWLPLFPVSGMQAVYGAHAGSAADVLAHLALPALSLGLVAAGVIARLQRTAMLEVLGRGYVRMARAKGLAEPRVLYGHAFRGAAARVVPVIGLQAGFVLGGAVYIETVFQWPGLGRTLVDAIAARDLLLVQGAVLVTATSYVLVNLVTDLVQRALDPRIEA